MINNELLDILIQHGLRVDRVVADGRIHRVPTASKKHKENGYYAIHEVDSVKNIYVMIYGDILKDGLNGYSTYKTSNKKLTKKDKEILDNIFTQERAKLEQDKAQRQEEAIKFYSTLVSDGSTSQYLVKKHLDDDEIKQHIIVAKDYKGDITVYAKITKALKDKGYQAIYEDGNKRFHGAIKGNYFLIGSEVEKDTIYITEGVADILSVYKALDFSEDNLYVSALSCENLDSVVEYFINSYPSAKIIVVGDNDLGNKIKHGENTGLNALERIKNTFPSVYTILPKLERIDDLNTDFNDVLVHDLNEAKKMLSQVKKDINRNTDFKIKEDGIYYLDTKKDEEKEVFICDKIEITSRLFVDEVVYNHLVLDTETGEKHITIANDMLSDIREFSKTLRKVGFKYLYEYSAKLVNFLTFINIDKSKYQIGTKKVGWFDKDTYILPHFSTNEKVKFYGNKDLEIRYSKRGTLDEWKANIDDKTVGVPELETALYTAFASTLVHAIDISFGLHFYGNSGIGKTALLFVAGSVFGSHKFKATWSSTPVALELRSEETKDALLLLDEGTKMKVPQLDSIYTIFNGTGKGRGKKDVTTEAVRNWNLAVISTGEKSIKDRALALDYDYEAGEDTRILDLFINRYTDGKTIDNLLRDTNLFYGSAIEPFVNYIVENRLNITELINEQYAIDKEKYKDKCTDQSFRALRFFSIMQVACHIAQNAEVISEFHNSENCLKLFDKWNEDKQIPYEEAKICELFENIRANPTKYFAEEKPEFGSIQKDMLGFYQKGIHAKYFIIATELNNLLAKMGFKKTGLKILKKYKFISDEAINKRFRGLNVSRCYELILDNTLESSVTSIIDEPIKPQFYKSYD